MDIWKNNLNGMLYQIRGDKVWCNREGRDRWAISSFSVESFTSSVGRGYLFEPFTIDLENE